MPAPSVTLDMFGSYKYGSELLNVTFDPSIDAELASYGYDDHGIKAEKTFIKDGIPGCWGEIFRNAPALVVANSCACSWNRPPMDRMANLNWSQAIELGRLIARLNVGST